MFSLYASICPFCEAAALARTARPQWHPSRHASTLQKRKPSRMVLSEKVAQSPPRPSASGKPIRKSRNSPFGGMNVTTPPREYIEALRRSKPGVRERTLTKYGPTKKYGKDDGKKGKDPMKALKMQRALSNVSYEKRGRVKQELLDRDSFEAFDLLPSIQESVGPQALGGVTDVVPTPIQRLAVPALLGMEDGKRRRRHKVPEASGGRKEMQQFLLAAETGSGKTLAYVLPIIDALKRAEAIDVVRQAEQQKQEEDERTRRGSVFDLPDPERDEPHPTTGRPRAIILLPTSELVAQVGALIKKLSHPIKFRSALISASYTGTVIRSRLFSPSGIDIVIATPHLLSSITESDPNVLSRVSHLVIDEADSLLDRSFSPITQGIIDRATPSLEQLVLCSATIPRSLDTYLQKRFPYVKRLVTPNLHAIPRRVQLSVIDIEKMPYQGNRNIACAQTIWDIGKEVQEHGEEKEKKIVVFVNERETAEGVAGFLKGKGIDATALSRDSDERKQVEVLASFTGATPPNPKTSSNKSFTLSAPLPPAADQRERDAFGFIDSPSPSTTASKSSSIPPSGRKLHNAKVLVMTDLGSRGIDTLLVKHVILYDVPHTSIDFIHRLGRVGRMGRRGKGVVLVGRHDRKDVVKEVREGMFKGQALI